MEVKSWTTIACIIATGFVTVVHNTYLLFKKKIMFYYWNKNNLSIYVRGKACANLVDSLKARC